jgi:hypothetical protein
LHRPPTDGPDSRRPVSTETNEPEMPDLAGPPVPMLELTAVRWLLGELAAERMDLAAAADYAVRAAGVARAVLEPAPVVPAQLAGQAALPLPVVAP